MFCWHQKRHKQFGKTLLLILNEVNDMKKSVLGLLCIGLLFGCGKTDKLDVVFVPAKGVVLLDGKPLANADIRAVPQGKTMGQGGGGRTNENGEFQLKHTRGEDGLPEGEYLATVSLRKNPDGSSPPPNDPTPPMDSPAAETLPVKYVDPAQSTLRLTVSKGGPEAKLELSSK